MSFYYLDFVLYESFLNCEKLKQGDPTVFGRLGEEILFFRSSGFEPIVVPGVSSALAGPTFAGIPLTQRGVAYSFTVCTGVGRNGQEVVLPGYERSSTLVVLMGVARLQLIVKCLLDTSPEQTRRHGMAYPAITPIAIIERGSMPDQRVVYSTLKDVVRAFECSGVQRPPGMIVIGWAVLSLYGEGDVTVLDDSVANGDHNRVKKWLQEGSDGWRVEEGLTTGWEEFEFE
jgi:uroporphyrin-III C-methyltransferase